MNIFSHMISELKGRILDKNGVAVKRKSLGEPVAGPTVGGVRPVISGHPAEGLTPHRLAQIHRSAAQGEPLTYFELAEDIEERDLHYSGVLSTRKRSVAQLPITVKAASDDPDHVKHADFVRSWIDDETLQAGLFDMLDAVGKGFSVTEIKWRYHMGYLCPSEFIFRPQRWFEFDKSDGETVLLRESIGGEMLPEHLFLVHRHPSKSGLTVRSGLARIASWAWMYKQFTMKDWAMFCQNYGQPIRIGRYGRNANEEEKDILWRAVTNIAGDCAAIMPKEMDIELTEVGSKGSTSDLYERRANFLDHQMSKAVLGQTTTTDAVSGGHAVAKEHRLVQEDIERSDATMISTSVNQQIVPNLVAFNFGPQDLYPKVKIGRPDEIDLETFSAAFERLAPQGLTAEAAWLRDRMGIPAPKEDAELVGGKDLTGRSANGEQDAGSEEPQRNTRKQYPVPALIQSHHLRNASDDHMEALAHRMEEDAAGALGGLTSEIRAALETASSLEEAAENLARLELNSAQLAEAMARGMALAHLAGQAALIDDIERRS